MTKYISFCFFLFIFGTLHSQNFAEDIAPLVYKHCSNCHRPGEIGPFPLTNYNEIRDRALNIKYVTQSKYMPPWKPDPTYQNYQHENFLTDAQIKMIGAWVDAGMPPGDMSKEPPFPNFPKGSQIGTPDLTLSFSQSYLHKGTGYDEYRYFVIPTQLAEDKDLVALEMRPGNGKIVHHTLFWADPTGKAREEDAKTPEYGFTNGGFISGNPQLPGYVPGQKPNVFTNGMSQKLPKGSDLVLQMHYAPTSVDESDSTVVNLFFASEPAKRNVLSKILLPNDLVDGPFIIPSNQVKKFHAVYRIPTKISLIGIWPHCHMLGKDWEVYAKLPDGKQINLIKISDWDFNWQGGYYFKKLIVLPQGTEIHAFATYDNTVNNPVNPNNPPKLVTWGEGTADEMFYLPLSYVLYQTGDENLVLNLDDPDANPLDFPIKSELYSIFPNPAVSEISVHFTLNKDQSIQINLLDPEGKKIKTLLAKTHYMQGQQIAHLKIPETPSGIYLVELVTQDGALVQKFNIVK
ncbi:MAG: T9SS type A sorting domain-containing protein [Saprospiraceae bacterium]|nr:T9SS type A sorting domain-containing protein [Saprospiraceae bacterium]